MRKLFAAVFAAVMIASLFVAVARSISSTPAETGAPYALEAEDATPVLSEVKERLACASCSHADVCTHDHLVAETELVRDHSICAANENHCGASFAMDNDKVMHEKVRMAAIAFHGAYPLKLPSAAAANVEMERDARSAACVKVEVLGVGVYLRPDRRDALGNSRATSPDLMM